MKRARRPSGLAVIVIVVGLAFSVGLGLATAEAHRQNERRLTRQRTREAAALLTAATASVQASLGPASLVASEGRIDEPLLHTALDELVGEGKRFTSVSIWQADAPSPSFTVGAPPASTTAAITALLTRAASEPAQLAVAGDLAQRRLSYAVASRTGGLLVYAEQALARESALAQRPDSPFLGLDYAIYLGTEEQSALLFSSTTSLPLAAHRASETVPFGDSTLVLVMAPTTELGGTLLARLPWIITLVGVVLTLGAAAFMEALQRRRRRAEELAAENERLFAEQRAASEALQRGLLPRRLPDVPGIALSARYAPGVEGTEIGGDWYDAFTVGDTLWVVAGDVSGRGLSAANVMASLRFAMRALAADAEGPGALLTRLDGLHTVDYDGHFATIICGALDVPTGVLRFANAGHPPPLLIDDETAQARFIDERHGPPVGAFGGIRYEETEVQLDGPANLILVTDGLIERRDEVIDVGLERLRSMASRTVDGSDAALDEVFFELVGESASDDSALLSMRWLRASVPATLAQTSRVST